MSTLTIVILTKNEEAYIETAIKNAKKCTDDVLVIDSGSTDSTINLALKEGARTVFHELNDDFAAQRNFALTQTDSEWIMYLDADERLDKILCEYITSIVQSNNKARQYGMERYMLFNGYEFHHGIFSPDCVYRLFPRDKVHWVGKVHEHPECNLPKEILKGKMQHYTYKSWHQWLMKADYYTTIWAEERYQQGKRVSLGTAFLHASLGALRALLIKRAFLDGWMGIISCGQHGFYTMLKYVKLYELQKKNEKD